LDRAEITGILVLIFSLIGNIYADLLPFDVESSRYIFSFLTGATTTYVLQHHFQKEGEKGRSQRELRDEIYGPMLVKTNEALKALKKAEALEYPIIENLQEITSSYLFFTVIASIRDEFEEITESSEKYFRIRQATSVKLEDAIQSTIKEVYNLDNIRDPNLTLKTEEVTVSWVSLKEALIRKTSPKEFVEKEKQIWGEYVMIQTGVADDLDGFEKLYFIVLEKMEDNKTFKQETDQRKRLIEELSSFIGKIEGFVK
jgi:hypothetical protein